MAGVTEKAVNCAYSMNRKPLSVKSEEISPLVSRTSRKNCLIMSIAPLVLKDVGLSVIGSAN